VKWNFEKIWHWHVENYHNYHRLHSEKFHYSYHNIIVDDGKIYNFKNLKTNSFLEKKNLSFCHGSQIGIQNNPWCQMVFSWLTNCMVNKVSIRYEPVLTGSHFSREPLGLGSNCFKNNLKNRPFLVQRF